MTQPERYVPRPGPSVEAWLLDEDNITDIARDLGLTVIRRFKPSPGESSVSLLIQGVGFDNEDQHADPGDFLVRHQDGQIEALFGCSFDIRYVPAESHIGACA